MSHQHNMRMSLFFVALFLFEFAVVSGSFCTSVQLVSQKTYENTMDSFTFSSNPALPSDLTSSASPLLTISFWTIMNVSNQGNTILRLTLDPASSTSVDSNRIKVTQIAGPAFQATTMLSTSNPYQIAGEPATTGSWVFTSIGLDYLDMRFYHFTYEMAAYATPKETFPVSFNSSVNWRFDSRTRLQIGGDGTLNMPHAVIANVILYSNLYTKETEAFLIHGDNLKPVLWLVFDLRYNQTIENQVSPAVSVTLSNSPGQPVWDYQTYSIDFSSSTDTVLSFSDVNLGYSTVPHYIFTISFGMSYLSQSLPGGCQFFQIFGRKESTTTYRYRFGIKDSQFVFVHGTTLSTLGGSVIGQNYDFSDITASCYLKDLQPGIFCVVYVNSTIIYSAVDTTNYPNEFGSTSYTEAASDILEIGGSSCAFPGKLRYFKYWVTGGLMSGSNCVSSCALTLGTISTDLSCLKGTCTSFDNRYQAQKCLQCDSSCSTCLGPGNTDCMGCNPGYFIYWNNTQLLCPKVCPPGTYPDSSSVCQPCDSTCATCDGPLSTNCLSCSSTLFYSSVNKTCTLCNTDGLYQSGSNCHQCDSSCKTCSSGGDSACTSCVSPKIVNRGYCLLPCPSGQYDNGGQCRLCNSNCQECIISPALCTSCGPGQFLAGTNCYSHCPTGYYKLPNSPKCRACGSGCSTCSGPYDNQCLECTSGLLYINGFCVSACPEGFFQNGTNCTECDSNCLKCSGSSANCTACTEKSFLQNAACVNSCSYGYYFQNQACVSQFEIYNISESKLRTACTFTYRTTQAVEFLTLLSFILAGAITSRYFEYALIISFVSYLKYLNVKYPANLLVVFDVFQGGDIPFPNFFTLSLNSSNISSQEADSLNKFSYYEQPSSFLSFYGSALSFLLIIVFCWFVVFSALKIKERTRQTANGFYKTIETVKKLLEWNTIISIFVSTTITLAMGITLQFGYGNSHAVFGKASLGMAIIFSIFTTAFIVYTYISIKRRYASSGSSYFQHKFKVLVHDFNKSFYCTTLIVRYFLVGVAIVVFNQIPLGQIFAVLTISIVYTAIIIRKKIYTNEEHEVIMKIMEFVHILNLLIILFMAFDDLYGFLSDTGKFAFGWVLVVFINLQFGVLFSYQAIIAAKSIYHSTTEYIKKRHYEKFSGSLPVMDFKRLEFLSSYSPKSITLNPSETERFSQGPNTEKKYEEILNGKPSTSNDVSDVPAIDLPTPHTEKGAFETPSSGMNISMERPSVRKKWNDYKRNLTAVKLRKIFRQEEASEDEK